MTFPYGQITAASPLALSAAFQAPFLNRPATSAVVAVRQALDQLSTKVRSETLEQIALREKTRAVIALAEQRLSKPMYDAFLLWGERAAMLGGQHPSDESLGQACDAQDDAVRAADAIPAVTRDDIFWKSYLVLLEQEHAGGLAPLIGEAGPQGTVDFLTLGLFRESRLVAELEDLSRMRGETMLLSKWPEEDAAVVADEFAKARSRHIRGQSALDLLIEELLHLDQLTRELDARDDDPINQLHLDAEDDLLAFRPTDVTQILRKIDVMSQRGCNLAEYVEEFLVRDLQALAMDAPADAERKRAWDEALADLKEKRLKSRSVDTEYPLVDEIDSAFYDAMDRLIERVPAPDLSGLTIKLGLAFQRCEHFEENLFSDHAAAIAADARRLGEAAGVNFDEVLISNLKSALPLEQAA